MCRFLDVEAKDKFVPSVGKRGMYTSIEASNTKHIKEEGGMCGNRLQWFKLSRLSLYC